jgi:hypothetical protein
MAIYAQALIGVGPIGSTQAGALASLFGAPWAMAIGAAVAGAVILGIRLLRPEVFTDRRRTPVAAAIATQDVGQSTTGT